MTGCAARIPFPSFFLQSWSLALSLSVLLFTSLSPSPSSVNSVKGLSDGHRLCFFLVKTVLRHRKVLLCFMPPFVRVSSVVGSVKDCGDVDPLAGKMFFARVRDSPVEKLILQQFVVGRWIARQRTGAWFRQARTSWICV